MFLSPLSLQRSCRARVWRRCFPRSNTSSKSSRGRTSGFPLKSVCERTAASTLNFPLFIISLLPVPLTFRHFYQHSAQAHGPGWDNLGPPPRKQRSTKVPAAHWWILELGSLMFKEVVTATNHCYDYDLLQSGFSRRFLCCFHINECIIHVYGVCIDVTEGQEFCTL